MYKDKIISVVVPAYNEELQIDMVVDTMPECVDHIVIVDDKSTDRTVEVVEASKKRDKRVVLIPHEVNQGVGGAIATGYKWSRDNEVDIAVVMAGDGQMDPNDLPNILNPVADGVADYSKGNRLISREAYETIPKIRYFGNSALSFLTKIASGYWHVADSQTGYTAINKEALHTIDWDKMYKRYGQPNDLLTRLNVENFRVQDVEIRPVYNVGEQSGIKIRKVLFSISFLLVRLFLWRLKEKYIIRDFHPLILFYALGAILLLLFMVLFARTLILWPIIGSVPELSLLSSLFCFSSGLSSCFFAMWFDMDYNKHLSPLIKVRRTPKR